MTNFLNNFEKKISKDFENNGFIIRDVKNNQSLRKIRGLFLNSVKKNLKAVSKLKTMRIS